jgi:hypothetical protein
MHHSFRSYLILFVTLLGLHTLTVPAHATLKFYYDPATGNVSLDTKETRSGALYLYYLQINTPHVTWEFRPENLIRLSTSTIFAAEKTAVGDHTISPPWRGLYTIGNVLPPGLSEEFWAHTFIHAPPGALDWRVTPYTYGYSDMVGGGRPPDAEFVYGLPTGEFNNKWDLIDPTTLTWAAHATLIYRVWNGEVLIDTTGPMGGYISSMLLESDGSFLPDAYIPIVESVYNAASDSTVFHTADALEPGRYSIGKILPAGLSPEEFVATFTQARFLGRAGFKGGSFDFDVDGVAMTLQFVPEPASCLLLSISGIACLCWRKT